MAYHNSVCSDSVIPGLLFQTMTTSRLAKRFEILSMPFGLQPNGDSETNNVGHESQWPVPVAIYVPKQNSMLIVHPKNFDGSFP